MKTKLVLCLIYIGRSMLGLLYAILKLLPTRKKILFLSRQSDRPSDDIKMLVREISQPHPDYKTVVLCKTLGGSLGALVSYCFHMLRQMYHLATSQVVILDSYSIATSLLHHKKSLLVIQMWHSVGTMKKFAYSIVDRPEGVSSPIAHAMRMHKNYDFILCAGEGYRHHLAEGFGYPDDKIIILPLPRLDLLKDPEHKKRTREKLLSRYPELAHKKNVLYIPTFRKNPAEQKELLDAIERLEKAFEGYEDRYNLIIKPHPLTEYETPYGEFPSFDFLFAADYVISDYSCIIYEAAVLEIPLFFYTYDLENYMETRDIYMDYEDTIPNRPCPCARNLAEAIVKDRYDMEKQNAFLAEYVDTSSEHMTKDIVDFIFDNMKKK